MAAIWSRHSLFGNLVTDTVLGRPNLEPKLSLAVSQPSQKRTGALVQTASSPGAITTRDSPSAISASTSGTTQCPMENARGWVMRAQRPARQAMRVNPKRNTGLVASLLKRGRKIHCSDW